MTKYHITSKGQPGKCRATQGNCPYGPNDQNHYDSEEQAYATIAKEAGSSLTVASFSIKTPSYEDLLERDEVATEAIELLRDSIREAHRRIKVTREALRASQLEAKEWQRVAAEQVRLERDRAEAAEA
jgi:iron only hydrogenase large subunit-like protein